MRGASDFTTEGLPKTRKALFFDVVKERYGTLLRIGLLLVLTSLPFWIASFYHDYALSSLSLRLSSQEITSETYQSQSVVIKNLSYVFEGVSLGIFYFFLAGSSYLFRQLAFEEPLFFHEDFGHGLKENGGRFALLGLMAGLFYYGLGVASAFGVYPALVGGLLLGLYLFLIVPLLVYEAAFSSLYEGGFFSSLKSCFLLYLGSLGKGVLLLLALLAPFFFLFIPSLLWKYLALLLAVLFYEPLAMVGSAIVLHGVFDEKINQKDYPELVNKGLGGK
jgi:hypothetical protein